MNVKAYRPVWLTLLTCVCLIIAGGAARADQSCSNDFIFAEEPSGQVIQENTAIVEQMVSDREVVLHASQEQLDFTNSRALIAAKDGVVEYRSLTVPVKGEYGIPSNLTVVFDTAGGVVTYSETLIREVTDQIFDVATFNDGELVANSRVDVSQVGSAEREGLLAQAELAASTMGMGAVAGCLAAVLGVSSAVAWLIAGACAGSCSVPYTPPSAVVCAGCVGAFAVLGAGAVNGVMGCFKYL